MVGEFRSVYRTVFFTSRKIPLTDVQSPSLALLAGKLEARTPDLCYQAEPGNEENRIYKAQQDLIQGLTGFHWCKIGA